MSTARGKGLLPRTRTLDSTPTPQRTDTGNPRHAPGVSTTPHDDPVAVWDITEGEGKTIFVPRSSLDPADGKKRVGHVEPRRTKRNTK